MEHKSSTKPGWTTTEFWAMIICGLFGVLLVTGVITNTQSNTWLLYANNIAGGVMTCVSVATYIFSRGKVKQTDTDYVKLLDDIKALIEENKYK